MPKFHPGAFISLWLGSEVGGAEEEGGDMDSTGKLPAAGAVGGVRSLWSGRGDTGWAILMICRSSGAKC